MLYFVLNHNIKLSMVPGSRQNPAMHERIITSNQGAEPDIQTSEVVVISSMIPNGS